MYYSDVDKIANTSENKVKILETSFIKYLEDEFVYGK